MDFITFKISIDKARSVQKLSFGNVVFILCALASLGVQVSSLNDAHDLALTKEEKSALDKLMPMVVSSLPEPFMKTEFYLIRFLRKANLDVSKTRSLLQEMVQWRARNNISRIINEDFSDFELDYQMSYDSVDKQGRPVLFINYGDWNLRLAVIDGKSRRLQRYLTMTTEKTMRLIFEQQMKQIPVTRNVVIVDCQNVNLITHGCPRCVAFLVEWTREKEAYYPEFSDETILINVPAPANVILNAIRAVMSPQLSSQIKSFDANRKVWMQYLDTRIDKSQRTAQYGGTKPS